MLLTRRVAVISTFFAIVLSLNAFYCAIAVAAPSDISPRAKHGMVVAETPEAAAAGVEILKAGGNAIDAATASALATGVTHAASCGIGGGGFMLIYLASTSKFYALDYRERAPLRRPRRCICVTASPTRRSRATRPSPSRCPAK